MEQVNENNFSNNQKKTAVMIKDKTMSQNSTISLKEMKKIESEIEEKEKQEIQDAFIDDFHEKEDDAILDIYKHSEEKPE
jgi:hypothetical protein